MRDDKKLNSGKAEDGAGPHLSAIPPRRHRPALNEEQKLSEEEILAKERALASGTLLVDGEPVHMMTEGEARHVFGETDNDLVFSWAKLKCYAEGQAAEKSTFSSIPIRRRKTEV